MSNPKKNILLVTRNLPPLVGGMENLLHHCALVLSPHYSLTVVGPKGCADFLDKQIQVYEVASSLAGFLLHAPIAALRALRSAGSFDVILGGSGLMAPLCWLLGKTFRVPAVCYVHGLDVVVASRIYQYLFVPCLRRLDWIIANSRNTRRLCIEAGIGQEKISIIHPGCDMPAVDRQAAENFLASEYGISAEFCLLFVGRIAPRKGLLAFMQNGFALLLQSRPNTLLVIAGDSPSESLAHRSDELSALLKVVEDNGWEDRVKFLGKVDNHTLSRCYAGADCLLFPLVPVPGDVEGFGMVAIEAAAHGTPTVAFDEGGVADAVNHGVSGFLLPTGDYDAMVKVLTTLSHTRETASQCKEHARLFAWDVFDRKLLQQIDKVIGG